MQITQQALFDSFYLQELKKQLEVKSSISIGEFNDCRSLSVLFANNGLAVSTHTFARLFGIIKANHRPYTSTLNLICEFLGYASYNHFCTAVGQEIEHALYAPADAFTTGEYSFISLEIAIANNDWNHMLQLLDAFDTKSTKKNEIVMLLGNMVRNHPNQQLLLSELIHSKNGKWLFYESFVDEDDKNNYYSSALKDYFQFSNSKPGNQLFLECFLASKAIYSSQSADLSKFDLIGIKEFPLHDLHFHEISRLFEIQLLLDFQNKLLPKKLIQHLDKICTTSTSLVHHDACWIVARSLKALAFAGQLKKAMTYAPFHQLVFERFQACTNKIESIAELIIQFVGHAYFVKNQKIEAQFPPSKIAVKHDNETNARILIEAATASLYAQNSVKSILDTNIHSFAKQTGQTWVFELLE
jgi:hypothetical protein